MLEDNTKLAGEESSVSQIYTTSTRPEQLQNQGRLSTNYNEVDG
jgi:hypothetical protein